MTRKILFVVVTAALAGCGARNDSRSDDPTPVSDAGVPVTDAGATQADAGVPATDAGSAENDAGSEPSTDAGTPAAAFRPGLQYDGTISFERAVTP